MFSRQHLNAMILLFSIVSLGPMNAPVRAEAISEQFNGLKLNAELSLARGKSIKDGVVLLIPSPLGHHRMELIVNLQDVLAQQGVNTLAPSLSLSKDNRRWYINCEEEIKFTADSIFSEIDHWVNWLAKQGANDVTLMGHSLSANYVTMYTARKAPDRVNRVIILAPATLAYGQQGVKRYESRYKVVLKDVLSRADSYVASGKGDQPMAEKTDFYFCPAAKVTANAFVSLYRDQLSQDFPTLWATMPKPALLVIGTNDQRSPQVVDEAKRATEKGSIKVVTIENGGHFFKGLYTDDAVDAMVEFIATIKN